MTIPTHRDAEAALRRLAEAGGPCPIDQGAVVRAAGRHFDTCSCYGTGRIARFPMLRRVCAYPLHDAISCWRCDSLGWTPLALGEAEARLGALLEAIVEQEWPDGDGYTVELGRGYDAEKKRMVWVCAIGPAAHGVEGRDDLHPHIAVLLALGAAVEVKA